MNRPRPPDHIGRFDGERVINIAPAHEVAPWVRDTFLNEDSSIFNQDHAHLIEHINSIGFLWARGGYVKQQRIVIGQTEQLVFRCGYWQKIRQEQQFHEWFGLTLPSFVITLDADFSAECSDADFCALVEHELSHIGQEIDKFGDPKFHRDTGLPKLCLRDHDVSEFVGIVRRYGVPAGSKLEEMVKAANSKPEVAKLDVARACGNCLRVAA